MEKKQLPLNSKNSDLKVLHTRNPVTNIMKEEAKSCKKVTTKIPENLKLIPISDKEEKENDSIKCSCNRKKNISVKKYKGKSKYIKEQSSSLSLCNQESNNVKIMLFDKELDIPLCCHDRKSNPAKLTSNKMNRTPVLYHKNSNTITQTSSGFDCLSYTTGKSNNKELTALEFNSHKSNVDGNNPLTQMTGKEKFVYAPNTNNVKNISKKSQLLPVDSYTVTNRHYDRRDSNFNTSTVSTKTFYTRNIFPRHSIEETVPNEMHNFTYPKTSSKQLQPSTNYFRCKTKKEISKQPAYSSASLNDLQTYDNNTSREDSSSSSTPNKILKNKFNQTKFIKHSLQNERFLQRKSRDDTEASSKLSSDKQAFNNTPGKNIINCIPGQLRKIHEEESKKSKITQLWKFSKYIIKAGSFPDLPMETYAKKYQEIHYAELDSNSLNDVSVEISKLSFDIWQNYKHTKLSPSIYSSKLEAWKRLYVLLKSQDEMNELFIVGSTVTGFSLDSSDVDMCLIADWKHDKNLSLAFNAKFHLEAVILQLKKFKDIKNLELIEAKVPLLRFTIEIGESVIPVDMTCNAVISIINSQLMYVYSCCDHRIKLLVCIIKQWARFHQINDAKNKSFSSYALELLVINFLQCCSPPIVPVFELPVDIDLYKRDSKHFDQMGLFKLTSDTNWHSSNQMMLGELLISFFNYYSNFNFKDKMISVRLGAVVDKPCVQNQSYCGEQNLIYIEEPIYRSNVCYAVHDKKVYDHILSVFKDSCKKINTTKLLTEIFK